MSKKQPQFRAQLPVMLSASERWKKVSKKAWDKLPEDRRQRRTYSWSKVTDYFEVIPIPPYPNPAVEALRNRLKYRRVNYFEWVEPVGGVPFIHFSTLTEDKIA